MENHVLNQLFQCVLSLLFGFACAACYDTLRLARLLFRRRRLRERLADIIFVVLLLPASFLFVLIVSDGVLRWHIVISALAAAAVYSFGIKRPFIEHLSSLKRRIRYKNVDK